MSLVMKEDLCRDERVSEQRIINHPSYSKPVVQVRYGWKRNNVIVWDKTHEIIVK